MHPPVHQIERKRQSKIKAAFQGADHVMAIRRGVSANLARSARAVQCNHVSQRLSAVKAMRQTPVTWVPEHTVAQMCQWVQTEHGMAVGPTAMGKTLACIGLPLKKGFMPTASSTPMLSRREPPGKPNKPRWLPRG